MNLLNNYPNFYNDILDTFGQILEYYGFSINQPQEGVFEICDCKCFLLLSYDRGDVYCSIRNPNGIESKLHQVKNIYRHIYKSEFPEVNSYDPKVQLKNLATVLQKKMSHILRGDFSWEEKYIAKKKN